MCCLDSIKHHIYIIQSSRRGNTIFKGRTIQSPYITRLPLNKWVLARHRQNTDLIICNNQFLFVMLESNVTTASKTVLSLVSMFVLKAFPNFCFEGFQVFVFGSFSKQTSNALFATTRQRFVLSLCMYSQQKRLHAKQSY